MDRDSSSQSVRWHQQRHPARCILEVKVNQVNDEYNLARFVRAQEPVYEKAVRSLRRGTMDVAYIDFIFPRLASDNGWSESRLFTIRSLDEASAYLSFPVLGGRYRECIRILQRLFYLSASAIFGDVGAKQLHASLTLFSEASNEFLLETMFDVWFEGLIDEATANQLKMMS